MLLTRCDKHAFLTARVMVPHAGPAAEGAGEHLRIGAEIIAARMGGAGSLDGGARVCDDAEEFFSYILRRACEMY